MMATTSPPVAPPENRALPHAVSSEFEVVRACCSAQPSRPGNWTSEIDWNRVSALAEHHGVMPQVFARLSQSPGVPAQALAALRQSNLDNTCRTLWLTRELGRVLERLNSCAIPSIAFKG